MKKYKIGMFVGTILLGLSLVGCKKKTNKDNTTTDGSSFTFAPVEKVIVEFDSNGGSPVDSQNIEKGTYATKPKDPTLEGYTFDGWYYEESKWIFDTFAVSKNVKLTAKWTINNYDISLSKNIDAAGTVSGEGSYEYRSEVTLTAETTDEGYSFDGWYDGETRVSDKEEYSFDMPANSISYEARWTPNQYGIHIFNYLDNENIRITSMPEDLSHTLHYDYGTEVTLIANNVPNRSFVEWYIIGVDGTNHVGSTYTITMPAEDINIGVKYAGPYVRENNSIYFGYYPQSRETDEDIVDSLNIMAGTLPTSSNKQKWTDYGYYSSNSVASYMWYIDIDYDNNGSYDYRGVYFDKYRPFFTSFTASTTGATHQADYGYNINQVYWFRYEIIKWNIISENGTSARIIADLALDCQEFYPSNDKSTFDHNNGTGYANDYALSNIRKWLKEKFYNTAFNSVEKELIIYADVDQYVSDYVFLLSKDEMYACGAGANTVIGTEYAKCQGIYVGSSGGSSWMLRSGYDNGYTYHSVSSGSSIFGAECTSISDGIRPVIEIKL